MAEGDKSLWDNSLEALRDAGLEADSAPTADGLELDSQQTHIEAELEKSKTLGSFTDWLKLQPKYVKYSELLERESWLCDRCKTINGLDSKFRVRKTCSKCKSLRLGSKTILSLFAEDFAESMRGI